MHLLTLTEPLPMGLQGSIQPGKYITYDRFGGSCLSSAKAGTATLQPMETWVSADYLYLDKPRFGKCSIRGFISRQLSITNERFLIVRPNGYGDLLFLTPAIRELKNRYHSCSISVCCMASFASVLEQNPYVDKVIPYPLSLGDAFGFDAITFCEGMIENHPEEKTKHAVDIAFETILGVQGEWRLPEDKQMVYIRTPKEVESSLKQFPFNYPSPDKRTKRIAIQVKASAKARTYPVNLTSQLVINLLSYGHEVFLMGYPGEILPFKHNQKNERLHNCSEIGLTFRESCALLSTCDALIGPDSALVHVGGILNIPTVALYGPFPWQTRTTYANSIRALSGNAPCAPCHFHKLDARDFPTGQPCASAGHCIALDSISPERIIAELNKVLK